MVYSWLAQDGPDGVDVRCTRTGLLGRAKDVAPPQWPAEVDLPGRELLSYFVEAEQAERLSDGIRLPHELVAALPEDQASLIGLPPAIPHALQLKSNGTLDEPQFAVILRWLKFGATPVTIKRQGAIAREGERRYRLPRSLLRIADAVDAFAESDTSTRERRVEAWLPLQESLEAATKTNVEPDGYLDDLRIFHAASLSLSVEMTHENGITFDPVLFGRASVSRTEEEFFQADPQADPVFSRETEEDISAGVDTLVDEADALLPKALQDLFLRRRFDRDDACREAYPLERNVYVVIDKPLRRALNVIKQKQKAPQDERRAFVKNPRAAFADALDDDEESSAVAALFLETQQYADRVTGIGLWRRRVLPWLPQSSSGWLPEKIGLRIGERTVEVAPENLSELKSACQAAMAEGADQFAYQNAMDIPATAETLAVVDALRETADRLLGSDALNLENRQQTEESIREEEPPTCRRIALEQDDNLEELLFSLGLSPRTADIPLPPPQDLIDPSRLYPHQREGFDWMVKSWTIGRPGILLADDMGLGKTVQTLAFAAWLHRQHETAADGKRGPILIVAPTALLKNWRAEHDLHLRNGGIGPMVELYGGGIRAFKREGEAKRDVEVGRGVLDREKLSGTSCILTTYETLANYHISLAAIRFPLIIFDEIQKLKTPTTINSHAAKTLNGNFVLGLTGTPVENNLAELWSIMDRLHPGLLNDLKHFNDTYAADDTDSLRALRDALVNPAIGSSVMLRRMKDTTDLGQALPPRNFRSMPRDMPDVQAQAYEKCIAVARQAERGLGAVLQALQRMRGVSLHPEHPATVIGKPDSYDRYIRQSARLDAAIEVLDEVRSRGEKALIFVEHLEMQGVLADILRHRYDLDRLPSIINGQTPSAKRHALVSNFQKQPEGTFDVMILGPRAAGLGLTITAANHVIHLSRWWNPAVEDQCNDRAYRIGQEKDVTVYYPIARHPAFGDASFDVKLDALLARKRSLSRDLLVPVDGDKDYRDIFKTAVAENIRSN